MEMELDFCIFVEGNLRHEKVLRGELLTFRRAGAIFQKG